MSLDTVIRGAETVDALGRRAESIGIVGGKIAGRYAPGEEPAATETIDATGLVLIPGLIDMHSHHREPGYEYKDTIEAATRQCAAGGVTTTVGMPNVQPPPNTLERLESMMKLYERSAVVDWNINPAGTIPDEIPRMAGTGIAAFKVFMVTDTGRDYPHMPGIGVHDHGELMHIMQLCAANDVPLMVHPHDQALMDFIEKEYWDRGERDALAYAKAYASYDGVIWETAIALLLRLQKATGVHLHLLHVQTAGSIELIRAAKKAGQKVSAEINPWALFLGNDWANIERLGSYALSYWVPEDNVPALWEGLADGTIDIVATDHAPHTREEKEIGWTDGWKAHTGTPSTQFYLRMLLDAVAAGRLTMERLVEATSTAPARLFRMAAKGRLDVGADADLVLVDAGMSTTISDDEVLSVVGWSPYAGRSFVGAPVRTLVRGRTVFENGSVVGEPGFGKIAAAIRGGNTNS
ncbi:MAG: amidohydrolase family protein 4 [Rhodoglobus sp.]|nr:amidohydrolase family protein 4 [Rhodoglobus sp.]